MSTVFYDNFVRLCARKNVPPSRVCVEIGANRSTYSRWSEGSIPNAYTLVKLADYFDVTSESLMKPYDKQAEDSAIISAYWKATDKERDIIDTILKEYM